MFLFLARAVVCAQRTPGPRSPIWSFGEQRAPVSLIPGDSVNLCHGTNGGLPAYWRLCCAGPCATRYEPIGGGVSDIFPLENPNFKLQSEHRKSIFNETESNISGVLSPQSDFRVNPPSSSPPYFTAPPLSRHSLIWKRSIQLLCLVVSGGGRVISIRAPHHRTLY